QVGNGLPKPVIRRNARAKHVRLRVTSDDGLVVVAPVDFDERDIPGLLEANREWIERALAETPRPEPLRDPPGRIELQALRQSWRVRLRPTITQSARAVETSYGELELRGRIAGPTEWQPALHRWLMRTARRELPPRLRSLAARAGFDIDLVSIRCQRSRWGSYASRPDGPGSVSLNAQLLFLPLPIVHYVMLHELCHSLIPDHSPGFWELLEKHLPDARHLRDKLADAPRYVPRWASWRPQR
ncbi:MAG: M48 family metallopeptidase, partial [Candidatus Bipolaricaulota bacterium]